MMSTLKKLVWAVGLLAISATASAQQIFFCESVDANGKPSGASNSFSIVSQGSFLNILVKLNAPVATSKVIFDIYRVDSLGKEKFESTSQLAVEPLWTWFNKGFTFYQPGDYVIYAYDESEKLIVAGKLKLESK